MFPSLAKELEKRVYELANQLTQLNQKEITIRKNTQNRSIKEIVGHMVDSASNNIHRVVHLQYRESPVDFPNYASYGNNDKWIAIQNYQDENWEHLIQIWKFNHLHFCHIIRNINPEKTDAKWLADKNVQVSLKEMVEDFPRHFELHIKEIDKLLNKSV